MPPKILKSAAEIVKDAIKAVEAEKKAGKTGEILESRTAPATTPRGGTLLPRSQGMYPPDVPQVDLPRQKGVDKARAEGKKPKYTERMQSLLDSPTVRKKVDKLIAKGQDLGMQEWYGTEPLRQVALDVISPQQYESLMAQLASASQRNPVDQQNLMGSYLYYLQQQGKLDPEAVLLTNKLKEQGLEGISAPLIEFPEGYGSLAQSAIFERGKQIASGDIAGALPPEKKLGTFYRNLLGNLQPVTVDVNAVRGPVIEAGDPRWLTSKLVEKDEAGKVKNVYFPRQMVEEGEMSIREAKQRPGFWEAAPSGSEYAGFEDLWQRAARREGVAPAEAQALGWYGSADVTALKTKPELYVDNLERLLNRTAEVTGKSPLEVLRQFLKGEEFLKKAKGGSIDLEAEYRMGKGGLLKKAVKAVKDAIQPTAPQDEALRIAQKNAAKPVSEGGLGLPPDNTPMDRAKAMGYGDPIYRGYQFGTGRNKATFYSSSPDLASAYAVRDPGFQYEVLSASGDRHLFGSLDEAKIAQQDVGGKIKKLKEAPTVQKNVMRSPKPLVIDAEGSNWNFIRNPFAPPENFENLQRRLNSVSKNLVINGKPYTVNQQKADILRDEYFNVYTDTNLLAELAKKRGYDSITIKNLFDVPLSAAGTDKDVKYLLSDVSISLKPENVRSRFAAFDPARIDESDLLAGFAALGITAPMLTSEEPEYRSGGAVMMADGGDLEEEYNLRKMGMDPTRVRGGYERKPISREEIQAMMLDVAAGVGVPFAEAGSYALRGKTDEAKESAAIEAALIGVPGAAVLAKPAYRAVKKGVQKAAPAARDLAREFLESGMESGAILDPRMQAIAYHGSPHKFEKFDASKIGTGEGAQVYGHGLYFAESPKVAKEYQVATSKDRLLTADGMFDPSELEHLNVRVKARSGDINQAIEEARKYATFDSDYPITSAMAARDLVKLERLKASGGYKLNPGNLYTVDIPDESIARMLDWDKPLGEQSPEVRRAIEKTKSFLPENAMADLGDDLSLLYGPDVTPNQFLNTWEALAGNVGAGERALRERGVPGVKYLDAGSRSAGEGTRNFVVFPGEEETVKILERKKRGGAVIMKSGGKVKSAADMLHAKGHQALMDFDNKTKKRKG